MKIKPEITPIPFFNVKMREDYPVIEMQKMDEWEGFTKYKNDRGDELIVDENGFVVKCSPDLIPHSPAG